MLTEDELARLVRTCLGAGCPVLLTLSVVGRVELVPRDPLDRGSWRPFDAHQRRDPARGRLLGPAAASRRGRGPRPGGPEVLARPSPWRLGPAQAALATEWLAGWVEAAVEQDPELLEARRVVRPRRRAQLAAGTLAVTVDHLDLLALAD